MEVAGIMAACDAFLPPPGLTDEQADQTVAAPLYFSGGRSAGLDPSVCLHDLIGWTHLRPSFDVSGQTCQVSVLRLLACNHVLARASKCLTKTDGEWGRPVTVRNRPQPTEMF